MKAISPVIATVIIVSVAIAIAVAVAFWMTGLAGAFTRFEKLEITSAYAVSTDKPSSGWNITVTVKNTGSSDTTIQNILINGKPYDSYSSVEVYVDGTTFNKSEGVSLPARANENEKTFVIFISSTEFAPGQTIEIKIQTSGGQEYPKSVVLP